MVDVLTPKRWQNLKYPTNGGTAKCVYQSKSSRWKWWSNLPCRMTSTRAMKSAIWGYHSGELREPRSHRPNLPKIRTCKQNYSQKSKTWRWGTCAELREVEIFTSFAMINIGAGIGMSSPLDWAAVGFVWRRHCDVIQIEGRCMYERYRVNRAKFDLRSCISIIWSRPQL